MPEEIPAADFVAKRPRWLRVLAELYLGLPLAAILLLVVFPLWIAWPLPPTFAAEGLVWPRPDLTLPQSVGHMLGLVVYFAVLKFVITRV